MKVLLTGYSGLLGRHIARELKNNGYWVRVILHAKAITKREINREVDDYIFGSMDNPQIIEKALKNIDYVIHSGWKFSPNNVVHPSINEIATKILFEQSQKNGIKKFVFISSISVYGMNNNNDILNESSNLASGEELLFSYPREKITIENILKENNNNSMQVGIFRPGPIFDDNKSPVKKMFRFMGNNYGLGFGSGKNLMPLIHAGDVACAVILWLKNGNNNDTFNVVPDNEARYKDWFKLYGSAKGIKIKPFFIRGYMLKSLALLATQLKKALGKPGKVDVSYIIASATRNLKYSNSKIKQILGWNGTYTQKYTNQNV